jgi:nucleotide-binding universal stress UspA family protein
MTRKLLLPTDFSKNALQAINYALKLYKEDSCVFYILNVFSATSNVFSSLLNMEPGSELYEKAKAKSEKGLAKLLDTLLFNDESNVKHVFKTISVFNNPVEAIKIFVEQKDIEIIVMGTKGESNREKSAFGSVAITVMEKVRNCPVIVVPEAATLSLPTEIVFPTNYKTPIKRRELNYLIDIAKKCSASIEILHICEQEKLSIKQIENKQLLEEYFEGQLYSFHRLSHYSVETAVNLFIESRRSDMVAFINRKHVFFGSVFTQPLVKELGFYSKVPILVMHDLKN